MTGGRWNRAARRSGGDRPAKIHAPTLSRRDLELMAMIEKVRRDFGEEGVERFLQLVEQTAADKGKQ